MLVLGENFSVFKFFVLRRKKVNLIIEKQKKILSTLHLTSYILPLIKIAYLETKNVHLS